MKEFVAAVGINISGTEIFFGSLGEIFVDFVGNMIGEIFFERICCCSGDKFCGCRDFFWVVRVDICGFYGDYVMGDFV